MAKIDLEKIVQKLDAKNSIMSGVIYLSGFQQQVNMSLQYCYSFPMLQKHKKYL